MVVTSVMKSLRLGKLEDTPFVRTDKIYTS